MVQRKVPNKLGTQADGVKSEKRLGNLKPTAFQHQDGRSRGPDMKKKMKRSRSIKLSNIDNLKSSPARETISQPGKPPPLNPPIMAATPQKQQSVNKATDWSPNYMKATSSSEARKERSQVSSLNAQSGSDSKNLRKRSSSDSSKFSSSASCSRPIRTLTKSSSLKLVRTLTKTPNFKPVRGITKKCARAALCADMKAEKATCSSTLKDSKFPAYLILNPGGTEAEGTSVMKVCPYTYCSLNGHHHTPLPPLKCFLKARRRSLKLQKSMKLEDLSPRRERPAGLGKEETDGGLLANSGEKRPHVVDSAGMDFFIEIYAKSTEDGVQATGKSTDTKDAGLGTTVFLSEREEQNDDSSLDRDDQEAETEQHDDTYSLEMNVTMDFTEVKNVEDGGHAGADYPAILSKGATTQSVDSMSDINQEGFVGLVDDDNDGISEISDMDWEEGQLPASEFDADCLEMDDVSCCSPENQSEIKLLDLYGKPEVVKSDDIFSNCTEEILMDEVLQELFEQESASSDGQCHNERYSEEDRTPQDWEDLESLTSDSTSDQFSANEDTFDEIAIIGEKDKEVEARSASIKEPTFDSIVGSNLMEQELGETDTFEADMQPGDGENDCINDMAAEGLNGHQEDGYLQAVDATMWLQDQIATSFHKSEEKDMFETEEYHNKDKQPKNLENYQNCDIVFSSKEGETLNGSEGDAIEVNEEIHEVPEDNSSRQDLDGESGPAEADKYQLDRQKESSAHEVIKFNIPTFANPEEQSDSSLYGANFTESNTSEAENVEVEVCTKSDTEETFPEANYVTRERSEGTFLCPKSIPNQEIHSICNNGKWTIRSKKLITDLEDERDLNWRDPNFLPILPEPEAEKVDLRHQMLDDRKNSEEWMLDHAIRQAVAKLAPARKRKVALLVEAFETVLPIPKYETQLKNMPAAFSVTRSIQACS